MKTKLIISVFAFGLLASCATPPDKIEAAYVSPIQYESYTCEQIAAEAGRVSDRAAQALGVQQKKAQGDAVKVGVSKGLTEGGDKLIQEKHLKDLESAFTGEVDRLDGELAAEVSRATAAEQANATAISNEVSRAQGEEARIEGKHDAYVTSNDAALAAEETARIAGDNALAGEISALSGAVAADFSALEVDFQAALGAEESARIAADAGLQSAIDAEKGRIDAMLSGSTVDFDTLKEIVDAYQLADTDIVTSIVTLDGKVDTEIADRIADVDAEEARALAAEAVLQANINNEAAARAAADTSATNDRAAIRSEFAAADSAEQTARIAADGVLQDNIDAEASAEVLLPYIEAFQEFVKQANTLVKANIKKREQIQASIAANVAKRSEFIAAEMKKVSDADKEEVFELSAFEALEQQAEAAGYTFE